MAKYLGNRPTAVPLTSADIEDVTIQNVDINDVDDSIIVITSVDGICDTLNLYRLDSENLQDLDPNNTFFAPQDETSY